MSGSKAPSGRQQASALLWGAGGSMLRILIQLGAQVALARMLGPETYGVFVLCSLVLGLGTYVADAGLSYALVHRTTVDERDLGYVAAWQLVMGLASAAAIAAAAPLVARLFGEPRMALPLQLLSVVMLLTAAAAPAMNLLKRDLRFKRLNLAQLVAYTAGYVCVGLPMAVLGAGVWSLVAAWLVQASVNLVVVWHGLGRRVRWSWRHPDGGSYWRFATVVSGTNVVNWTLNNLDKLLVGRLFAAGGVGLYATAFNLVNTPANAVASSVQAVVFSSTSRLRGDEATIRRSYVANVALTLLVAAPLFGLLAALAEPLVLVVYGEAWRDAGLYLKWFALCMPVMLVWGVTTPTLWNTGRISQELRIQLLFLPLLAAGVLLASRASLEAIAVAVFCISLLRLLAVLRIALRQVSADAGQALRAWWPSLAVAVVPAAAAAAVVEAMQRAALPALATLAAGTAVAVAAAPAALYVVSRHFPPDVRQALETFLSVVSPRLVRFFRAATRRPPP